MTQNIVSKYAGTKRSFSVADVSSSGKVILSYDSNRGHQKQYEIQCTVCKKILFGSPQQFRSKCSCLMKNRYIKKMADRIGSISLTDRKLISYDPAGLSGKKYTIECLRCGNTVFGSISKFTSPCKKCSYEKKVDLKNPKEFVYEKYSYNSMMRNLDFLLTLEEFSKLIKMNCFFCDSPPNNRWKMKRKKNNELIYNGIDRIDNNKGYFLENCVTCCSVCNRAKGTMSLKEFKEQIIKWIKVGESWTITD